MRRWPKRPFSSTATLTRDRCGRRGPATGVHADLAAYAGPAGRQVARRRLEGGGPLDGPPRPLRLRGLLGVRLEHGGSALAGPDADRLLDGDDEDLPVPRLARVRELEDGIDRTVDVVVVHDHLEL